MRHATRLLVLVGALVTPATIIAASAPTVFAETPAEGPSVEGAADANHDEAGAPTPSGRTTDPRRLDRPCFPVSVPVWAAGFRGDDYVKGWASVDRTERFTGQSCQVKGWVSIDPCGRAIPAYLAGCPDGAFTFTKTEADCYAVVACRDPHATAGYGASR